MTPATPRFRRPGVRSGLLIALAIPLALLAVATAQLSIAALRTSSQAAEVSTHVDHIEPVVRLGAALFDERLAVEQLFSGEDTTALAPSVLRTVRAETDNALASIGFSPIDEGDLLRNRQVQDRDRVQTIFPGRYAGMVADVDAELRSEIELVNTLVASLDAVSLQRSVTATQGVLDASTAAFETVVQLRTYWAAADFERAFIRSELAGSFADFERAAATIDTYAEGDVRTLWLSGLEDRTALSDIVNEALRGSIPDQASAFPADAGLGSVPASLVELSATAAEAASSIADETSVELRRSAINQILATIAFLLLSLLAVALVSRSILRPLRRLSAQARAVARGDLEVVPLTGRGAEEVHVASLAFNDLVENLQLAERKVAALGAARLDDAVLKEPLPGRMGQSLDASFSTLSSASLEGERLRKSLVHQASHDALTGILNREAALLRIEELGAESSADGSPAITLIELSRFKAINDTYGHSVGDEVLGQLAERFRFVTDPSTVLARLGGDEFALISADSTLERERSVANLLLSVLTAPFLIQGLTISVTGDIGLAVGHETGAELLAGAAIAVDTAKQDPGNTIQVYDEALRTIQQERAAIGGWVIDALQTGAGLSLEYQPIVSVDTIKADGVEALLRFRSPDGALVRTDRLIDVAEQSALVLELGQWVLDTALRQLAAWASDPKLRTLYMSINVSALQLLDPEFPAQVAVAIEKHHARSEQVTIEVTETALITDAKLAAENLDRLRDLGIAIAVDDFGTGYTSVGQLRSLPVDKIKIDKSLVDNITTSAEDHALASMVITLARQLGLELVAEGVETSDQLQALTEMGVSHIQGWLISRSLTASDIEQFVHGHTAVSSQ